MTKLNWKKDPRYIPKPALSDVVAYLAAIFPYDQSSIFGSRA
jgi:hypothetical protein